MTDEWCVESERRLFEKLVVYKPAGESIFSDCFENFFSGVNASMQMCQLMLRMHYIGDDEGVEVESDTAAGTFRLRS